MDKLVAMNSLKLCTLSQFECQFDGTGCCEVFILMGNWSPFTVQVTFFSKFVFSHINEVC